LQTRREGPLEKGRSSARFIPGKRRVFAAKNPEAESQETCASRFVLALFARKRAGKAPHYFSWGFFIAQINSRAKSSRQIPSGFARE
jgi:hypothetical protein